MVSQTAVVVLLVVFIAYIQFGIVSTCQDAGIPDWLPPKEKQDIESQANTGCRKINSNPDCFQSELCYYRCIKQIAVAKYLWGTQCSVEGKRCFDNGGGTSRCRWWEEGNG